MNRAVFWLCACCFAGAPVLGQQANVPAPTAEVVREQIRRLDPRRDTSERRTALAWLSRRADSERTDAAIPALERCVRNDPEPDVRRRAIATWARLELRRKRPCPAGLVEAMLSPTDEVRWEAGVWVGQFREFALGAIPVMLRGAKSATPDIRGNILFPLARAARKDRRLLAVIRGRTKDADWDVRDCAHLALYRATDQVEDYLLYLARERHAARKAGPGGEGESAEAKRLRERRNLLLIGAAGLLSEWLATRPKDVARVACRMLDDEAASERGAAANLVAEFANLNRLVKSTPRGVGKKQGVPSLAPLVENTRQEQAARTAQLAKQLRELGVFRRLTALAERDPEKEVRRAADEALRALKGSPPRSRLRP